MLLTNLRSATVRSFWILTMENDPLRQLTEFFETKGYIGKEAVEEAKNELDKRRKERELELKQTAGTQHHLASVASASITALYSFKTSPFQHFWHFWWLAILSFISFQPPLASLLLPRPVSSFPSPSVRSVSNTDCTFFFLLIASQVVPSAGLMLKMKIGTLVSSKELRDSFGPPPRPQRTTTIEWPERSKILAPARAIALRSTRMLRITWPTTARTATSSLSSTTELP